MRPKLSISASKGASNTAQAASGNSGPRHDNHHVRVPFLHGEQPRRAVQAFRRNQDILAPVLRQDIQPLPARTALYARPGPRLARQTRSLLAPAFHLIISDISAAGAFTAARAFRAVGACALKRCAGPWRFPDGA